MITKGRKKGTFRFVYSANNTAGKVAVAGDFTQWEPLTMRKQKNGSYAVTVPLAPGTYQYKFRVNDAWMTDPDNEACCENQYGTLNSVVTADGE